MFCRIHLDSSLPSSSSRDVENSTSASKNLGGPFPAPCFRVLEGQNSYGVPFLRTSSAPNRERIGSAWRLPVDGPGTNGRWSSWETRQSSKGNMKQPQDSRFRLSNGNPPKQGDKVVSRSGNSAEDFVRKKRAPKDGRSIQDSGLRDFPHWCPSAS